MKKKLLIFSLSGLILSLLGFFVLRTPSKVFSVFADHIVFSEIQLAGGSFTDEFIELYNPTDSVIDLSGWRLTRKTSGGSESNLISSLSDSISPKSYFLIGHSDYDGSVALDATYSASTNSIAVNNTILLYSDAGSTLVDKIGLGTASDYEASASANPSSDGSLERKAFASSTTDSMGSGGLDEMEGNGEDTDNNYNDYVLQTESNPQNSSSAVEPVATPSPTPTVTPSPTPTISPTPSPTPPPSPWRGFRAHFLRTVLSCEYEMRSVILVGRVFYFPKLVCERI